MAVESTDLAPGTPAPDFALPDVRSGRTVTLADVARGNAATLVMFICRHCPYVQHVVPEIGRIARDYANRGLGIVAISSNDVATYPDDAPASLAAMVAAEGWDFPFLYDESQEVARAYRAVCTPEFYLFDRELGLAYHGQIDDSRHKNTLPLTGADLRAALDAVLAGRPTPVPWKVAVGCSIKWKAD